MKAVLNLANDMTVLPVCMAFTESFAKLFTSDRTLINNIILAAEEAFCHTVSSAYEPGETGEINITAESDRTGLKLTIHDMGLPFDSNVLNSYDPAKPDQDADSLGLFLIRQMADEVRWEHMGAGGNKLTVLFQSPVRLITEIDKHDPAQEQCPPEPVTGHEYEIRFAEPSDAIHISRCIYRTYGYTYLSEDMYYPDKISRRIEDKTLISAIAVCDTGEVVGHASLAVHVPGILAESGQAVVSPAHRGHQLLERMKKLLSVYAGENSFRGICSEPVTNHTRSQQTSLKTGSRSCGLMLGYLPASFFFKQMDKETAGIRRSCVYNYILLNDPRKRTVYVPEVYSGLVKETYGICSAEADIVTAEKPVTDGCTELTSANIQTMQIGIITVKSIGKDCAEQVKQGLFHLTMRTSADMVYLNVPIEDEGCVYLINRARELGFVFCTLAMNLDGGRDMLRLQFINSEVDYDGINLVDENAEKIFSFIKKELKG